jgi:hypothetical protein
VPVTRSSRTKVSGRVSRSTGAEGTRLRALGREWSLERVLLTALTATLAATAPRRALAILGAGIALRAFGWRCTREVEQERYALKALRGDFDGMAVAPEGVGRAQEALRAVLDENTSPAGLAVSGTGRL